MTAARSPYVADGAPATIYIVTTDQLNAQCRQPLGGVHVKVYIAGEHTTAHIGHLAEKVESVDS
ncbi:MAG: hypothetical protein VX656_14630 [Candidatus Latescibacterota bacterium]|nr:hypothetical protein [Candidatus Latescibacterota bacterium]